MPRKTAARTTNVPKPTLGDTDAESDDDTAFRSPEPEDGTDYGLEFTTSRLTLQDANNRRCSTLRKDTNAGRRTRQAERTSSSAEEDEENYQPELRQSNRQERQPASNQQQSRQAAGQVTRAGTSGTQAQPRRRKAPNPISRARRMDRDIRRLQENPGLLIPKLPFSRLVRELIVQFSDGAPLRVTEGALLAMQESSEMYLTQRLSDAYLLTRHRSRVTLEVRDMALMSYICDRAHR
ncbi:histone H3-like centromeric protein cid [Drosophila ficusphila]|uniref:histone H3-like centromeric protein cid n=1 Tax=Drosophila ficusphila TaxID=30025 RepID=UPI0007E6ACF5|nr:histone H3-like centromeric protein cid [Drosophila ficusphila]